MPGDPRPIGVFDSGMGGLTVLRALATRLPQERFVYLGDTARLPYGTKSAETVQSLCAAGDAAPDRRRREDGGDRVQHGLRRGTRSARRGAGAGAGDQRDRTRRASRCRRHPQQHSRRHRHRGHGERRRLSARDTGAARRGECGAAALPGVRGARRGRLDGRSSDARGRQALPLASIRGSERSGYHRARLHAFSGADSGHPRRQSARTWSWWIRPRRQPPWWPTRSPPRAWAIRATAAGTGRLRFFATDSPERFARVGAIFLGRAIDVAQVELVDLRPTS